MLFVDHVSEVGGKISGYGIFILVFLITHDVIRRYIFNRPTSWGFEISEYLMLYVICLGLSYTQLEDRHVKVELLVTNLSQRVQTWLRLFAAIVGLVTSLLLTWKTGEATYTAYVLHWKSNTQLLFPLFPIYIIMPFGFALFALVFVSKIYHYIIIDKHNISN
jgi:TRAP-type C4-dicarboxylate transport system permease small subunit